MSKVEAPKKRVIIVDDEPAAIQLLRSVVNTFTELEVVAEVGDGRSAISTIIKLKPDIVFLDIEMPEVNGFEVAKATEQENYQLVFVTAYDHYALDAFNTKAIDYLLKPARTSLIEKCINKILYQEGRVLEALQKRKPLTDTLVLSDGHSVRMLAHEHIRFIEGIGRYRRIHLSPAGAKQHKTETIISDTTLDDFESQLAVPSFMRLHRSYIVKVQSILSLYTEARRHFVRLADVDVSVPVSRAKVVQIKASLSNQ